MKKTFNLFALIVTLGLVVVLSSCKPKTTTTEEPKPVTTTTEVTPPVTTTEEEPPVTTTEPPVITTEPEPEAPVITVNPLSVEIHAGEEVELLFGVSATDKVDGTLNVIVLDDDDFDNETPGTYTITYKAVNSAGVTATATRTIVVGQALSQLALEVRENKLGEQKWQGKLLNFKNELFVEVTEDQEIAKKSGVFYNSTNGSVTITVEGGYGVAAVLDQNGKVIEGRDGANSKLVNQANPTRAGSTVTKLDADTTVASAFARDLVIPAKGYAVVIQANYAGTTADSDGRGFMNYNVIYEYGNVVKLYWVDSEEVITPYVNQAPTVSGNTKVTVVENNTDDIEAKVKQGLVVKDDNGTFALADDVTITEVTIKSNGGYNAAVIGEYTFTLTATDGTLTTEFTRVVEVIADANKLSVTVGNNKFDTVKDAVAINQDLTGIGNYSFIIYTPAYEGEELEYTNGYGEAFLLDEYGTIVLIFDGANGRKFTEEHHSLSPVDTETCNATTYLVDAFAYAKENNLYLIVAPHSTANSTTGGSRQFLLSNRSFGAQVLIDGIEFKAKTVKLEINGKSFEALEELVVIDQLVTAADAGKKKMIIYTPAFEGETITCNGYGVALVLNQYGELDRVYDGANGKLFDAENPSGKTGAGFGGADYATKAFEGLQEGETLVILPNDGVNAADSARSFGLGLRMDGSIGKTASITGMTFKDHSLVLEINGKSFKALFGTYAIDELVTEADAGKKKMIIYTPAFEGETITCNGYGVALVLNQYGELDRVYDGANGKLFDAENPSGKTGAGFGGADYATKAFEGLQEGETLVILPNDGVNAADSARSFGLGLRMDGSIGKQASITNIEFEVRFVPTLKIGNNTFAKEGEIKVAYNDATATSTSHDFLVFTSDFTGTSAFVNSYGEAFVIKDGKVVRIYDGANGKYFDADNTAGVQDATKCTAAGYFSFALSSLGSGEWLLVAPHDGGSNVARGFLVGNRTIGADVEFNMVEVETSTKSMNALMIGTKTFFGASILIDAYGKPADYDFALYAYGYTGRVIKNGWCEAFVVDMSTGKVVRIYDGVNGKYYDADNTAGVANKIDDTHNHYTIASMSLEAFESLQPGELLVLGFNGGKNSNAGRTFLVGNRTYNAQVGALNVNIPAPAAEEVDIQALVVDGDKYYLSSPILADADVTSAAVPFLIYTKEFTGSPVANGYGEAFVIKDGSIVRVYDGANAKYYDADNTGGVQDATKCTAGAYLAEAFASLQEGEWILCAPNGGTTGNVARGFLLDHKSIGKAVVLPEFEE